MNDVNYKIHDPKVRLAYQKACNNLDSNKDLKLFFEIQLESFVNAFLFSQGCISEIDANVFKSKLSTIQYLNRQVSIESKKYLKELDKQGG